MSSRGFFSNTGPWTLGAEVPAGVTRRTISGLTNGTPYFFTVRAVNQAGEGPNSNVPSATPQAGLSLRATRWNMYD